MMISEEQRNAIKAWVIAGDSLADVQKKLKSEYELTMTYMDVRLLVLEIGAEVQDEPEPEPEPEPVAVPPAPQPPLEQAAAPRPGPWQVAAEEAPHEGESDPNVSLSIDRLVVPGSMVSGDVTFSDGTKARWMIDNQGRFGLEPEVKGYEPTDMDLQMFQMQLRTELQRKGYA
ncbi:MAG: hypothetical protein PF904_00905 [Kiritimatiellae bacterium]|jgi:hypothetical protein|nr:hypothetical protein [Kiritimatiellia bacterium]